MSVRSERSRCRLSMCAWHRLHGQCSLAISRLRFFDEQTLAWSPAHVAHAGRHEARCISEAQS